MQAMPHVYRVAAQAELTGGSRAQVTSVGLPPLTTAPPAEFDGPGDCWSPETLLTGAIADCFVFTFIAVARASKFAWQRLDCQVEATLDKSDHGVCFTAVRVMPELTIAESGEERLAGRLLEKAERNCLVTNSLRCDVELAPRVVIAAE